MNIISCPQIVDNFLNKEKGLTQMYQSYLTKLAWISNNDTNGTN